MFDTLRSQLLSAASVVVLIASGGLMWFTYSNLSGAVRKREVKAIRTAVHFVRLKISSDFNSLLVFKADSIRHSKNDLQDRAELALSIYSAADASLEELLVSDKAEQEKQWRRIVARSFAAPTSRESGLLLMDQQGAVRLTSDSFFQGTNISDFIDMNGEKLGSSLSGSFLSRSGEFAVFRLKQSKDDIWKLGYFLPLPGRDMVLCAVIDISTFVRAEKKKEEEIIRELDSSLAGLSIARTGFAFVFDGQKKILIPPAEEQREIFSQLIENKDALAMFIQAGRKKEASRTNLSLPAGEFAVYTSYFKGFDWYFSIVLPEADIREPAGRLVGLQMVIIVAAFGICLALLVVLVSRAVRPLEILSRKIEQVPHHDFTGSDHTALLDGLPLSARNEIGRLSESFAFMVDQLSDSIRQLVENTAANERIESELNIAREMQLGTLPTEFSFDPDRKELEIYAYLVPALEVGGDLYDFFFIDDDNLCFTVGDVAGKGIPAALFMVITKKLVSSNARLGCGRSPGEMMTNINEMLYRENHSAMFVTLFIGILNVKTGELRYANGGHVPPIFSLYGAEPAYRKDLSGPVVGVIPGVTYRELTAVLEPGTAVFLCTDGVTEAMSEQEELFGDKQLLDSFTCLRDASCRQIVDGIMSEIRLYAGTAPQSDDIAMLMVRWGVEEDKAADF